MRASDQFKPVSQIDMIAAYKELNDAQLAAAPGEAREAADHDMQHFLRLLGMGRIAQTRFWFVHARAKAGGEHVNLAVAAFTERSAKRQARIALGAGFDIEAPAPVRYAHAWVMNHGWSPKAAK
jgi:predicted mannosyl-3-phosphoglycerate phosphatase (HAD superfamily)